MPENLHLVTELAIILISAGVFTIISRALKQPVILGYIVAGFLVGPHLGIFPQFSPDSIKEWSELGIIFLLFGLGLEFSFKKMMKIGSSAFILAGITCLGMFVLGMTLGDGLGWTTMEKIFLGGMLGMSSTAIIIKAYDDMGMKSRPYAPLVFGALVFEDLIAILLMVLLSALAVTGKFEGKEMLGGIVKLLFFLVLWFLVGIYLIPIIFKKAKKFLSDEILLLVGIGMCFLMVVLANLAGFSSALGAFVMGSILSETTEGARIEELSSKIKDLFGAIFFVSVGMMVDPAVIAQYWKVILAITFVAMAGILLFSTLGSILAGQGISNSVHVGFTMAQIGEFSFILAGLGCSLGVLSDFIYPVIIASSVITTFATPFMIKCGDPVSGWLERVLPPKLQAFLNPKADRKPGSLAEKNEWVALLKHFALRMSLYCVLAVAVCIACNKFLPRFLDHLLPQEMNVFVRELLDIALCLVLVSPFVAGIMLNGQTIGRYSDILLSKNPSNRWPLLSLSVIRALVATSFILAIFSWHFDVRWWASPFVFIIAVFICFHMTKASASRIRRLESTFYDNLNKKEEIARRNAPVSTKVKETLAGYDVNIKSIVISPDFTYAGKTLREMPFRKHSGVNIIKILRGSRSIIIPGGDEPVFPGDTLLAVGTDAQLSAFADIVGSCSQPVADAEEANVRFAVKSLSIGPDSPFSGVTLRSLDMRNNDCMVVSIVKPDGTVLTNPLPDQKLSEGDKVWIAGAESSVDWYVG